MMNRPSRGFRNLVLGSIILFILLTAGAIGLAIYNNRRNASEPNFEAKTKHYQPPSMGDPDVYSSEYLVACSNNTFGSEWKSFRGKSYIVQKCQQPRNQCLQPVCLLTGDCDQILATNATCADDSDCTGENEYCNLNTCGCSVRNFTCVFDSDCPTTEDTCSAFTCETGTCTLGNSVGSVCFTNSQCTGMNEICLPDCTCGQLPGTGEYVSYTPTFIEVNLTSQAANLFTSWNFTTVTDLIVLYKNENTFVEIRGSFNVMARSTTDIYPGFEFTLPIGLPADLLDATYPGTGDAAVGLADDSNTEFSDSFLSCDGKTIVSDDATIASFICYNDNGAFVGPVNDSTEYIVTFDLVYNSNPSVI